MFCGFWFRSRDDGGESGYRPLADGRRTSNYGDKGVELSQGPASRKVGPLLRGEPEILFVFACRVTSYGTDNTGEGYGLGHVIVWRAMKAEGRHREVQHRLDKCVNFICVNLRH